MTLQEAKDFITAWYACKTMGQLCQVLGMDRRAVQNQAANFRRHGVPMPRYPHRSGRPLGPILGKAGYEELARHAAVVASEIEASKYRNGSH